MDRVQKYLKLKNCDRVIKGKRMLVGIMTCVVSNIELHLQNEILYT